MENVTARNPAGHHQLRHPAASEELGAIITSASRNTMQARAPAKKPRPPASSLSCASPLRHQPIFLSNAARFVEAIGVDYKKSTLDAGQDPTGIESKVSALSAQQSGTQAVLALGPDSASPSLRALQKMGLKGKMWFATFDCRRSRQGHQGWFGAVAIDSNPTCKVIPGRGAGHHDANKTTDVATIQASRKPIRSSRHGWRIWAWRRSTDPRHIARSRLHHQG